MCAAVKINRLGKFDLNPRGNLWLKDENRFGHKLLSKMGWSQGKGLGKNEDGIAENVKVRMRTSNAGVGWTEKMPLAMESDEYDAVLANLSENFKTSESERSCENNLKSLEHRSQQFRNRLHYGKFVKGKDVCQYSEKDMNSIFIMKKNKTEPKLVSAKSTVTNVEISSKEDEIPESLTTFKSQMSMKEYFESKLKQKSMELPKNRMDFEETNISEELHTTNENACKKKKKTSNKVEKSEREGEMVYESLSVTKQSADAALPLVNTLEQLNDTAGEGFRKKRKKDDENITNRKKLKLNILEESNQLSNELDNDITLVGEYASPEVQFLSKRKNKLKSEKQKSSKLKKLKSCFKNSVKYSIEPELKEVSFNKQVFYRVIDNILEDNNADNKSTVMETNILCDPKPLEIGNQVNSNDLKDDFSNVLVTDAEDEKNSGSNNEQLNGELCDDNEDEESEVPNCLDLPKCDKSNYDSWLENQRMAVKMKLYKSMIKKMKKHPILRTTNLLHIKGYGNWGF